MTLKTARCAFLIGIALFPARARALELVDAVGMKVQVANAPARIVTLAPSLGELAADIAGEHLERIVGVSEYTDYPPGLKHAKSIGPYNHVNLELIAALKPDLILATEDGNMKDQIQHLRELGFPVIVVATENFGAVAQSMRLVARAMGDSATGDRLAAQFETGLERIRAIGRARPAPRRRVLLQIGDEPLIVVGKRAFLNDALDAIGAVNLYGDLEEHYPRPALEDALTRDPDTVIVLALGGDDGVFQKMARRWGGFPRLAAVKQGRVRVLHADALLRPSMRLLEGLSALEKGVYGP